MDIQELTSIKDVYGQIYKLDPNNSHKGGQGIMYPTENNKLAIKLLFNKASDSACCIEFDDSQYTKYQRSLVQLLSLPALEHLSLPVASVSKPYCGYVMQFMEGLEPVEGYLHNLSSDRGGYVESMRQNGGLRKRIGILRNLADVLRKVHNHGLVYCDLTPKNIFVSTDKNQHEAWLIDVDNLCYANDVRTSWQTPWYRAPELYNGGRNSIEGDCYSFALIAYELLTFTKPFQGSAYDDIESTAGWDDNDDWDDTLTSQIDQAQHKAESGELSYVYEEKTNNRRLYGIALENVTNEEIRELFQKTFSKLGRSNPFSRPTMNEWYHTFDAAYEQLTQCGSAHWHFSSKCFLCEGADDRNQVCKIVSDRIIADDSTGEIFNRGEKLYRIYKHEKWFKIHTDISRGVQPVTIEIPWKFFAVSSRKHNLETTAFTVRIAKDIVTVEGCYDPKLRVAVDKESNKIIHVMYDDTHCYELTIKEVN